MCIIRRTVFFCTPTLPLQTKCFGIWVRLKFSPQFVIRLHGCISQKVLFLTYASWWLSWLACCVIETLYDQWLRGKQADLLKNATCVAVSLMRHYRCPFYEPLMNQVRWLQFCMTQSFFLRQSNSIRLLSSFHVHMLITAAKCRG